LQQITKTVRVFVFAQTSAYQQRQDHDANAENIGARRVVRHTCDLGDRHSVLFPKLLARQRQLIDGLTKDVLGEHQAALGRQDKPLRPDGSDRQVLLMPGKQGDGRNQLAQKAEHGTDVERQLLAVRKVEHVRQPPARDAIRDEEQ
jgi:hypothetical protein